MAEYKAASEAHQLAKELKEIRAEWFAIRTRYMDEGPDVDIPGYGEEWLEAITVGHQPRFPKAFHDARWQVLRLMCDRFAPWAHRVACYFGVKAFPIICSNPSLPKHPFDINNSNSRSRLLTGTDNTIEAGKRMILWGSAYATPTPDQTDNALRDSFPEWAREFVEFGDHHCRPIEEAMEWVAAAFDKLCRAIPPIELPSNPHEAALVMTDIAPPEQVLPGVDDAKAAATAAEDGTVWEAPDSNKPEQVPKQQPIVQHPRDVNPVKNRSSPSDDAVKCYRLRLLTGMKQQAIADHLTNELGRPISQGQVSRWLTHAEEWIAAGNVLPDLPIPMRQKPTAMDPNKIEMGLRQDGHTPRQRHRRVGQPDYSYLLSRSPVTRERDLSDLQWESVLRLRLAELTPRQAIALAAISARRDHLPTITPTGSRQVSTSTWIDDQLSTVLTTQATTATPKRRRRVVA